MSKNYNKIMDKIEVTEEMQHRILANIEATDFTKETRHLTNTGFKKYLPIAACFAILLVGTIIFSKIMLYAPKPPIQVTPDIRECTSLSELSETVGFAVQDLKNLPFVPTQTTYAAYWKSMAQITYQDEEQSIVFRKAIGSEDISGDYTDYPSTTKISTGTTTITLKGIGEVYTLATWTDGTYTYSLRMTIGRPKQAWQTILADL